MRSGGNVPSAMLFTGTIASIMPTPRKTCGHSNS